MISIHALREERDRHFQQSYNPYLISIHALREERDYVTSTQRDQYQEFQSTRSARSATP